MAKKQKTQKTFKGQVISEFKVAHQNGTVTYSVGSIFETTNQKSLEYLVNLKKIKK